MYYKYWLVTSYYESNGFQVYVIHNNVIEKTVCAYYPSVLPAKFAKMIWTGPTQIKKRLNKHYIIVYIWWALIPYMLSFHLYE